jgi:signal peptidase I
MFKKNNENPEIEMTNSEELNMLSAEENPARDFFDFIVDLLKTTVVVLVVAVALRYFAIQPYVVDGESMMPTYENKEYIIAEKISYMVGEPKRGDVVVFKYPKNPTVNYIKRIIALPGETIKISSDRITIKNLQNPDGFTLDEEYIPQNFKTLVFENNGVLEKTLGENEYFVLGDNREHSSDSREWGVLPKSDISGRAWVTLFPFDRIGIHKRVSY